MAHERPDELVGLIYDTVVQPQQWRAVLDQIAGRLGAQAAALISLDSRDSRADIALTVAHGMPASSSSSSDAMPASSLPTPASLKKDAASG